MPLAAKHCTLLLVLWVAVCAQLHTATFVPGMGCRCDTTSKFIRDTIVDFNVSERGPGCDHAELIVTVANPGAGGTTLACLSPEGKLAKAFLKCWDRIHRDESQKKICVNKSKKRE